MIDLTDLEANVNIMRRLGITSLTLGDVSITLGPATPTPVQQTDRELTRALADSSVPCSCGHDVDVEHNEHGCLLGCSADLCGRTKEP